MRIERDVTDIVTDKPAPAVPNRPVPSVIPCNPAVGADPHLSVRTLRHALHRDGGETFGRSEAANAFIILIYCDAAEPADPQATVFSVSDVVQVRAEQFRFGLVQSKSRIRMVV